MTRTNLRGMLASLLLMCMLLPLSTLPLQAGEIASENKKETQSASNQKKREGVASYYAKYYNGRKTNSGERYNPEKLTAAHPDLPLGTRVRVVNLANDREVVVRINDRCRKRKFPFIDLSRTAAQQLGFFGKGITKVRIIPLDSAEDETPTLEASLPQIKEETAPEGAWPAGSSSGLKTNVPGRSSSSGAAKR